MLELIKTIAGYVWTHRVLYAGLAGAYGAACLGLDKEIVQQIVCGIYVALVVRG